MQCETDLRHAMVLSSTFYSRVSADVMLCDDVKITKLPHTTRTNRGAFIIGVSPRFILEKFGAQNIITTSCTKRK